MAGRHRAASQRSLKVPAAAGTTLAALGLTAALTAFSGPDESPGEASIASQASHLGAAGEPTTTTSDKPTTTSKTKATATKTTATKTKARRTLTATIPKQTKPPAEDCSTELDGTVTPVAQVGNHILTKFDVDSVGGRASRGGDSDHPSGLALDFMVDPETGDALADYVLANQSDFGVTYLIWQQQYNDGSGWSTMEDRGSPTANHMDHVHVSFSGAPVDVTC